MTEEERESIIEEATNRAVERALLALPEVIGNLMVEHATAVKLSSQFYKEHPEFKDHKNIVAAVLEAVDGQDTLASFDEKLKRSIPEIKSRIALMKRLDMETAKSPNRDFSDQTFGSSKYGEM